MNNLNYTDFHGVDEDDVTAIRHGARWSDNVNTGVAYRNLYDDPVDRVHHTAGSARDDVASMKNKTSGPSKDC